MGGGTREEALQKIQRGQIPKVSADCEPIERDPFTGQVIRRERREILANRSKIFEIK